MTRRLPAPPPPGTPDAPPPSAPEEDDDQPIDEIDFDDVLDGSLLDPDRWPDDLDEPTVPDGLLEREPDLTDLPPLEPSDFDDDDDLDLPLPEDLPLDDDLTDLTAPEDTDFPILPWSLQIDLDGAPVPARVEPHAERTTWYRPGHVTGERAVVLHVHKTTVRLTVKVEPAAEEGVVLGRDLLSGRFLIRP